MFSSVNKENHEHFVELSLKTPWHFNSTTVVLILVNSKWRETGASNRCYKDIYIIIAEPVFCGHENEQTCIAIIL